MKSAGPMSTPIEPTYLLPNGGVHQIVAPLPSIYEVAATDLQLGRFQADRNSYVSITVETLNIQRTEQLPQRKI